MNNIIKHITLILILLTAQYSYASILAHADSINRLLEGKDDSLKIEMLSEMAGKYRSCSLEMWLDLEKKGLDIARQANKPLWIARAHLRIGCIYSHVQMFDEAGTEFMLAVETATELADTGIYIESLHELALNYLATKNDSLAIVSFERAIKLAEIKKDSSNIINNRIKLAEIYIDKNDFTVAAAYLEKCLVSTRGEAYREKHVKILLYLAAISLENEEFGATNEYLTAAAKLAWNSEMFFETARILYYTGIMQKMQNKPDLAITHLNLALEFEKKYNYSELIVKTEQDLVDLYKMKANYDKALMYSRHAYKLKDSLARQNRNRQMAFLDMKYDSEEKLKDLELLRKEKAIQNASLDKQKRFQFYALVFFLIMLGGAAFSLKTYFKRKRVSVILNHKNKQLEETRNKLLESEKKLKELNDTKTKLFSIMAHDLINPFNALLGYASLLEEGSNQLDRNEIKEYSQAIHESAINLYALLENLLQWSRSQERKIVANKSSLDITELINSIVVLVKAMANNKSISIEINSEHDCRTYADHNLLSSALRNLVQNAIKFSPQGAGIKISSTCKDKYVSIAVIDKGVGISIIDQEKLFSTKSLHSTRGTFNETGAGLGLVISSEFVKLNGGEIEVESKIGKGSTFRIRLPREIGFVSK